MTKLHKTFVAKNTIGSTDLHGSIVGLGTVKFGRNTDVKYPHGFDLPTDEAARELLAYAKDLGINLLDTAPAYGTSEERLGKLLHKQRHDWIIVGKAGEEYENQKSSFNFTKQHILASIERSLRRLKTDYIDLLLIHSDGNDEAIINDYEVFATLSQAKTAGLIRYYGMSTKTVTGGLLTIQHSDVAMVCYNQKDETQLPVLDAAKKHKKGILIKKALASGYLSAQEALNFVYAHPSVNSAILGTLNQQHLMQNVQHANTALQTPR